MKNGTFILATATGSTAGGAVAGQVDPVANAVAGLLTALLIWIVKEAAAAVKKRLTGNEKS